MLQINIYIILVVLSFSKLQENRLFSSVAVNVEAPTVCCAHLEPLDASADISIIEGLQLKTREPCVPSSGAL